MGQEFISCMFPPSFLEPKITVESLNTLEGENKTVSGAVKGLSWVKGATIIRMSDVSSCGLVDIFSILRWKRSGKIFK